MSSILPEKPDPIPRENPFRAMAKMAKTSIGKLPGHLVIIFCVALTAAVLFGVFQQYLLSGKQDRRSYLVMTIKPEADKPALKPELVEGVWVTENQGQVLSLKMGNGLFELIIYDPRARYSRFFMRGGYRFEGNVLVFQQRKDLGTPVEPRHLEIKYHSMQFEHINLYAESNGRSMVWTTPFFERRSLGVESSSIFLPTVTWTRIALKPS